MTSCVLCHNCFCSVQYSGCNFFFNFNRCARSSGWSWSFARQGWWSTLPPTWKTPPPPPQSPTPPPGLLWILPSLLTLPPRSAAARTIQAQFIQACLGGGGLGGEEGRRIQERVCWNTHSWKGGEDCPTSFGPASLPCTTSACLAGGFRLIVDAYVYSCVLCLFDFSVSS